MSDELRKILASVFRTGKGQKLSKTEMRNLLIFNLRWFDPDNAKEVVSAAISSGYVEAGPDGMLSPTFEVEKVPLEIDYRPPRELDVKKLVKPLFERMIEALIEGGLDKKEVVRSINRKAEELTLLFPAAAVHVGLGRGTDMSRFYGEVENFLLYGDR